MRGVDGVFTPAILGRDERGPGQRRRHPDLLDPPQPLPQQDPREQDRREQHGDETVGEDTGKHLKAMAGCGAVGKRVATIPSPLRRQGPLETWRIVDSDPNHPFASSEVEMAFGEAPL